MTNIELNLIYTLLLAAVVYFEPLNQRAAGASG
jgi:hypothetical protein